MVSTPACAGAALSSVGPSLLPLGAHCFGTETDFGGPDAVDVDSYQNAAVVVPGALTQELTITVTNTFGAPPPAPGPEGPPSHAVELPNTGAPVDTQLTVAALSLAAGVILAAIGRRRSPSNP